MNVTLLIELIPVQVEPVFRWLLKWDETLSGFGSIILTGALVYLYKQQQKILRAEQLPLIETQGFERDGEDVSIVLSNFGKGHANSLELVLVGLPSEGSDRKPAVATRRMSRLSESGEERGGRSIRAGESNVIFEARIGIPYKTVYQGDSVFGLRTGIDNLASSGVEVYRLHFYVRYEDALGDLSIIHVRGLEFSPQEGEEYEQILQAGGPVLTGLPRIDPESLSLDLSDAEMSDERTVI